MNSQNVTLDIKPARTREDIAAARHLFEAYVRWLDIDLAFQAFAAELHSLPGKYSPQAGGELLLAKRVYTPSQTIQSSLSGIPPSRSKNDQESEFVGCVAVRQLSLPGVEHAKPLKVCELKRLYVSPSARGLGAGRALLLAAVESAKALGYAEMRLDSLPRMAAARALYEEVGFTVCEQYYETPLEDTIFMKLSLE